MLKSAAAALFMGAGFVCAGEAQAFRFHTKQNDGLCVEVLNNRIRPGTPLVLGECNSGQENQAFAMDVGTSRIYIQDAKNNDLCVDAAAEGERLRLVDCGRASSGWHYERRGMVVSDTGLCWDVSGKGKGCTPGGELIGYPCHGQMSQRIITDY